MVSSWLWRPHLLDLRRSAITSSERSASSGNRFVMIKLYIRRCTVTGWKVFLTLTVRRIGYRVWTRRMRSVLDGMIVNVLREIRTRGVPVPWRMTQIVSKRTTCPSLAWRSRWVTFLALTRQSLRCLVSACLGMYDLESHWRSFPSCTWGTSFHQLQNLYSVAHLRSCVKGSLLKLSDDLSLKTC